MSNKPFHSVSFHPLVRVRDTLHIADYSDEEVKSCFYSQLEVKKIKIETGIIVSLMKLLGKQNIHSPLLCMRGLESANAKSTMRDEAMHAVLSEQDFQQANNARNHHILAEVYAEKTNQSQAQATTMGLSDQEWVSHQKETEHERFPSNISNRWFDGDVTGRRKPARNIDLKPGGVMDSRFRRWLQPGLSGKRTRFQFRRKSRNDIISASCLQVRVSRGLQPSGEIFEIVLLDS